MATFETITAAAVGGGSSYLVYTALLSQTGTSTPVETVLEDTVGAGSWVRQEAGLYYVTTTTPFAGKKIYVAGQVKQNSAYLTSVYNTAGTIEFYFSMSVYNSGGFIEISLEVFASDTNYADLSAVFGTGNFILPKIEVYS